MTRALAKSKGLALASLLSWIPLPHALAQDDGAKPEISVEDLESAFSIAGLEMTEDERRMMLRSVRGHLRDFERLRGLELRNDEPLSLRFEPRAAVGSPTLPGEPLMVVDVDRPETDEDLAFASIRELAGMVRSRSISCLELCDFFLARLESLDPQLECVIQTTPERARARARELDTLLDEGVWLGPLHGIPYGAKDLLKAEGAPTTWGAAPYREQELQGDAAVVRQLDRAGAVLIAKLSLGALAMGDVWFGGRTNNPWKLDQGSSGSSAGSASATAAGCVPFAIGSETLGSILSPSARCGVTGLRPTFGSIDTDGAMVLSWSMDKLGPIGRRAEDTALVFEALQNPVARAQRAFRTTSGPVDTMRVGVLDQAFADDDPFLDELRGLGCELVPFEAPEFPTQALLFVLTAEAAAAFDDLTRNDQDDLLRRQGRGAWPNILRTARLIPAVEYLQAQRLRVRLMDAWEDAFAKADVSVFVHPIGPTLADTNLCGQPSISAPRGVTEAGTRGAVGFTARNYHEDVLLRLVQAWQDATEHDELRPKLR